MIPLLTQSPLRRLGVALTLALSARATDWQSLVGDSPFGPASAAAAAPAAGELEFRGVVQEEGVYFINLYNPATKTSQWLPVKGRAQDLEVQAYDAGTDKVRVTQAGRTLTLPLKQAHVALAQAPAPAPAPENPGPEEAKGHEARRAEIRARWENGGGAEAAQGFRSLPPEAQQMIQEFRRRRAEAQAQAQPAAGLPAPVARSPR